MRTKQKHFTMHVYTCTSLNAYVYKKKISQINENRNRLISTLSQ